jgi:hypothetical protein
MGSRKKPPGKCNGAAPKLNLHFGRSMRPLGNNRKNLEITILQGRIFQQQHLSTLVAGKGHSFSKIL